MSNPTVVQGIQVYDGGQVPLPSPPGVSTLTTQAGQLMLTPGGSSTPAAIGGGGGSVASVTGAASGIVDNTDPANPVVQAQFGSDTTVKLPDSGATLVDALELVASLTDNTPGASVSQWLVKTLLAGVKTIAQTISAAQTMFPAGTAAVPGVAVGETGTGISEVAHQLVFSTNGSQAAHFVQAGQLTLDAAHSILALSSGGAGLELSGGDMYLNSQAGFQVVVDNTRFGMPKGANVASAQPLTLGADGNYFIITGTTGIQGIVTTKWFAGTMVQLQLASGITITHNSGTPGASAAAILLRAGANLTTSGTYLLELYYNGTNWIQPS